MRKITGKIGLMFWKLTFYVGKQASYLQLYLNDTSKLKKCEKVLNSGKFYRPHGKFLLLVFSNWISVLKNFTIFQ